MLRGWTHGKKRHVAVDKGNIASRTLRRIIETAACAGTWGSNDERPVMGVDNLAVENCIFRRVKSESEVAVCGYEAHEAQKLKQEEVEVHLVNAYEAFECCEFAVEMVLIFLLFKLS